MARQCRATGAVACAGAGDRLEQLVQPALLPSDGEQLGGEVRLCVRVAGALGERDRCVGQPLCLFEPPGQPGPHSAPRQCGVAVERLTEMVGQSLELRPAPPRLHEVAELDEVEDEPVTCERRELVVIELAREGDAPPPRAGAVRRRTRCAGAPRACS